MADPRAHLPSVTALLSDPNVSAALEVEGHDRVVAAIRLALEDARDAASGGTAPSADAVSDAALGRLARERQMRLRSVINATGVLLHTNLGRAPLSEEAVDAMTRVAGPTNLEFDLRTGARGARGGGCDRLLASLCGAADALLVNNGAAALMLVMAALAHGSGVVVSRGELVEIGGSFRLPDVLRAAGVRLVEVGTTNRTHLADYRRAIRADTGAVLRVHPSNYEVVGFASRPSDTEIAEVARDAGVPFVHDIGSGLLRTPQSVDCNGEPTAVDGLEAGADLMVFSGDKLLGGPQAGAIVGRGDLVERCRRHPLARAVRMDKLRLAALEATLDAHARGPAPSSLPVWRFLETDPEDLRARAAALARHLDGEVVPTEAVVGGGSLPHVRLASFGVRLAGDAEELAARLREGQPPIIGRVVDGSLVLDLRAVPPDDDATIVRVATTVMDGTA